MGSEAPVKTGTIFAIPLSKLVIENGAPRYEPLGRHGAGVVLARDETSHLFVAALDTFGATPADLKASAGILTKTPIDILPNHRGMVLARGIAIPDEWIRLTKRWRLTQQERELVKLYLRWKSPRASTLDSLNAYETLGGCSEGFISIMRSLDREWRVRFDRDEFVKEHHARQETIAQREREKVKPTWQEVAEQTVAFPDYTGSLTAVVALAFDQLRETVKDKRTPEAARDAIRHFFTVAYQQPMSGEYRDEIAYLAAQVGQVCGLEEREVYQLV